MPKAKLNNPKTNHGSMKLFAQGGIMATKDKAQEMRHAKTLRKLASEEQAEANKMACGGKVKKMARGGGIEIKGKTRGRIC